MVCNFVATTRYTCTLGQVKQTFACAIASIRFNWFRAFVFDSFFVRLCWIWIWRQKTHANAADTHILLAFRDVYWICVRCGNCVFLNLQQQPPTRSNLVDHKQFGDGTRRCAMTINETNKQSPNEHISQQFFVGFYLLRECFELIWNHRPWTTNQMKENENRRTKCKCKRRLQNYYFDFIIECATWLCHLHSLWTSCLANFVCFVCVCCATTNHVLAMAHEWSKLGCHIPHIHK